MTFNPGFKVKIIDEDKYPSLIGKEGLIVENKGGLAPGWYEVEFPCYYPGLHEGSKWDGQDNRRYFPSHFLDIVKEEFNDPEYEALLI